MESVSSDKETDEHMETLFWAAKGSFCLGQPKIIFPSSEFLLNLICFSYIPLSTFYTSYFCVSQGISGIR